jgi:Glyoxalase/Bleomycin resistance protein/Dioxygenase superfamily
MTRDIAHLSAVELYTAVPDQTVALKNQASRFPGRGANVRRLDHVNFLAAQIAPNDVFLADVLGARRSEQILLDRHTEEPGGSLAAVWFTVTDKSYDLVYTNDWTGRRGRLHHIAFATDTREDILRSCDVFLVRASTSRPGPISTPSSRPSSSTGGSPVATASNCATPAPGCSWHRTIRSSAGPRPSGQRARPGA